MDLAGYTLHEVVADGRTGRVYHAVRQLDGAAVALRQIRPDFAREPAVKSAILSLPRDVGTVVHPAVLVPQDSFEAAGAVCVVEEWVEGRSVKQMMALGRVTPDEAMQIALDVLDGLAPLHARGIFHGDISPQNLVVTPRGTRLTGLQVAVRTGRRRLGSSFLRDAWEAPEVAGGGPPTATTDLFAVGACLHAALTGEESWQNLPPALDPLTSAILRSMAPDEGQRYPDAQTFRAAILALRKQKSPELQKERARPAEAPVAPALPDPDRKKVILASVAVVVVLVTGGALWAFWPDAPRGMVEVPAGTHYLGDASGSPDERPGFTWSHPRFFIDHDEVRVGEYERCVKEGACSAVLDRLDPPQTDDREPRVGVTWLQAQAYCLHVGKRLPTEDEWEVAARPAGAPYPWGADSPHCDLAVYGQVDGGPCPPTGRSGLRVALDETADDVPADLAGNAWEWVDADYTQERRAKATAPPPEGRRAAKVLKGGAWSAGVQDLRAAARLGAPVDHWAADVGFRCAKSPD